LFGCLDGVRLSLLGTSATVVPIVQLRMIDDDERGAVGGMSGSGNRSGQREADPVPLCPPKIPYDLTWTRTLAAAANSL
jgi:hypothetical protein